MNTTLQYTTLYTIYTNYLQKYDSLINKRLKTMCTRDACLRTSLNSQHVQCVKRDLYWAGHVGIRTRETASAVRRCSSIELHFICSQSIKSLSTSAQACPVIYHLRNCEGWGMCVFGWSLPPLLLLKTISGSNGANEGWWWETNGLDNGFSARRWWWWRWWVAIEGVWVITQASLPSTWETYKKKI